MVCTHPIVVKGVQLPCGRCTMCKIAKVKEWSVRLMCESIYWKKKCMVTLTYSDEFVPCMLYKSHLQNFFKRLRQLLGVRIKYYACGEYGDSFGRPHFHAIIFGTDDYEIINKAWNMGFVMVKPCLWTTIRYVCEYVHKKYNSKWNKVVYGDKEPPFQVCSNGIGLKFVEDYASNLRETLCVPVHGEPINLPRYFIDKLGINPTDLIEYNSRKNRLNLVHFSKRLDKKLVKIIDDIDDLRDLNSFNIDKVAGRLERDINYQRETNIQSYLAMRELKRGNKRRIK